MKLLFEENETLDATELMEVIGMLGGIVEAAKNGHIPTNIKHKDLDYMQGSLLHLYSDAYDATITPEQEAEGIAALKEFQGFCEKKPSLDKKVNYLTSLILRAPTIKNGKS